MDPARIDTGAESFLFRLDPRTKILLTPLLSALVFIIDKPAAALAVTLGFMALAFAAKMPFKKLRSYCRFLPALIAFITVLQLLFGPGERYLLKPLIPDSAPIIGGSGSLKWDGLVLGLVIGCRLAALMLLLPMLTLTTGPRKLTLGLTRLGLNYRAAYVITTALNLIPAFEADARNIMDAQKLRGLRVFEEGGIAGKLKAYPALAIPLIIGAMRRAQQMGIAMDARGFGAFKTKTWLETIRMGAPDYAAITVGIGFTALALTANFLL